MSIDRLIQPGALAAMALTPCLVAIAIVMYSWWLHRAPERPPLSRPAGAPWPSVDLIVPVFNESKLLARKLANVAGLRYARDRLRIIVVDGASTDGSIVRSRKPGRGATSARSSSPPSILARRRS